MIAPVALAMPLFATGVACCVERIKMHLSTDHDRKKGASNLVDNIYKSIYFSNIMSCNDIN